MNKRDNLLMVFFVGIALSLSGCSGNSGDKNETPTKVQVERIGPVEALQDLTYSGTIEESESIPHSFPSPGTVSRVYVTEGEFVKKGEVLATLDSATFKNSYAMMEATQQQAEDAYNRLTPMHKNGTLPEIKYVEVETGLQKAKAAAAIARKSLDDCSLFATSDGYVGKRSIEPGSTAVPGLPAITIVKINKVFARISVSENEVALIQKRQKAAIVVGALGSAAYIGTVEEIGVVADPIAHSYRIKVGVQNKDLRMKPGMICTATIESPGAVRGVLVPSHSVIVDESGKNFVYLVSSDKKAIRKYVVTGRLLNSGIEVLEGLHVNDVVVVAGQHKLVDNASVQTVN
jgi:membrane fusion protein, multidrug efflux system